MMTIKNSLIFLLNMTAMIGIDAFTVIPAKKVGSTTTSLNLDRWVADMIDGELFRESHKKDFNQEWMEKNRNAILQRVPNTLTLDNDKDFRQEAKDKRLAKSDPQAYCADRCLSTGNCAVYEDFYHMTPEKVMSFCSDCVLSEGEEPCDIPEGFYDEYSP